MHEHGPKTTHRRRHAAANISHTGHYCPFCDSQALAPSKPGVRLCRDCGKQSTLKRRGRVQ
jgi:ribosomal protein L37AE/L43A